MLAVVPAVVILVELARVMLVVAVVVKLAVEVGLRPDMVEGRRKEEIIDGRSWEWRYVFPLLHLALFEGEIYFSASVLCACLQSQILIPFFFEPFQY